MLDILIGVDENHQETVARVKLNGFEVRTEGFCQTEWANSSLILANGAEVGIIEVFRLKNGTSNDDELSWAFEKALVDCTAGYLGLMAERMQERDDKESTECHLRAMGDLTWDGIWVLDVDDCTTYVNPRMAEMLGRLPVEIIGKPVHTFVDVESIADAQSHLARQKRGDLSCCELELTRNDGSRICVSIEAAPTKNPKATVRESLLVVRDITESKRRQVEIVRRSVFDELLARILSSFCVCLASEIDANVRNALRGIADFIGVDHAWVMSFSDDRFTWSTTHEWSRTGARSTNDPFQGMPMAELAWIEELVKAKRSVTVNKPGDEPRETVIKRQPQVGAGCVSRVCVPITATRGRVVGCLGLHSDASQMTWCESDVSRMTLVGNAIALAIECRRASEETGDLRARLEMREPSHLDAQMSSVV